MKLELITAEGPATLWMRKGRLIRFPQLTMPLLAALTPGDVEIHHTDEIVSQVCYSRAVDLVGITTTTCSAPHAYDVVDEFRRRGVGVILGGPHPTLLPHEAARHADSILIGEAEGVWFAVIRDFQEGRLKRFYRAAVPPSLAGLPWARRELIERRAYGRGVLVVKQAYSGTSKVKRGDIVVFMRKDNGQRYNFIYRVVALPGEKVEASGESLSINDEAVRRVRVRETDGKTIFREQIGDVSYEVSFDQSPRSRPPDASVTVPPDQFFVMSDNRFNARDSHYFGPVTFRSI